MKKVVVIDDSFSGSITIDGVGVTSISGTWKTVSHPEVTGNGKSVVMQDDIGEYICPVHGSPEQVKALATSSTTSHADGKVIHRVGDSIECLAPGHTNLSVVSTSGQSNIQSN